jgi:hypothetical protein
MRVESGVLHKKLRHKGESECSMIRSVRAEMHFIDPHAFYSNLWDFSTIKLHLGLEEGETWQ